MNRVLAENANDVATNINVCIRVRPLTNSGGYVQASAGGNDNDGAASTNDSNELQDPKECVIECWSLTKNQIFPNPNFACPYYDLSTTRSKRVAYQFDHVFFPVCNTMEIYTEAVEPVVLAAMQGYHAVVFAYGQTNSGKTHTMQGTGENPGIVPLAVQQCFNYAEHSTTDREFLLRLSYLEIG